MPFPEDATDPEIQPPQPEADAFVSATEAASATEVHSPEALINVNPFNARSVLGYILFAGSLLAALITLVLGLRDLISAIHPFGVFHLNPVFPIIFSASLIVDLFLVLYAKSATRWHWLRWTFLGDGGLRGGWSIAIFAPLMFIFTILAGFVVVEAHLLDPQDHSFTAVSTFFREFITLFGIVGAAVLIALIERRRSLLAFNLTGPRRLQHFLSGLAAGFLALSALAGALAWGHWLHFDGVALSGLQIYRFGAIWAAAFLLVGCYEEGLFRCYLQFTFARALNFWWALGIIGLLCLRLVLHSKGNGLWGVYAIALLGLLPCLALHIRKTPRSGYWQAAWVTSTLFGYVHTSNGGENWIGIFAAALIGFVFCVSIYVTGSAWWAIGCHAAWDWSETFFYGTPDSGMVAPGHLLKTSFAGNEFWSGGADGPEGSILVIGVILLLLAALLLIHGRKQPGAAALERALG